MSEKYLDELKAWRAEVDALAGRVSEKRVERERLERELAGVVEQLVDTPAGDRREELVFYWRELRASLEITTAEMEALSARVAVLRTREPKRIVVRERV